MRDDAASGARDAARGGPAPPGSPPPVSGPRLLKAYLFLGSSVLVIAVFLFTTQMVGALSSQVRSTSSVIARFCAEASLPATEDLRLQKALADLIASLDFPIVITDTAGIPRAWRGVGVPDSLVPGASIDSVALHLNIAPAIRARLERVRAHAAAMDRQNAPITMNQIVTRAALGQVHYGEPPVLERLRWMPTIAGGGLVLLISLGLWGLTGIRQAEKRTIWVGMARETAHQLGTPLSSLLGWIELLRSHAETAPAGAEVRVARAEFDETLDEMERDVERLTKVAQRFSHVGSLPRLQLQDVTPVVMEAVQYVRRRLPREREVVVRERYEEVPPINLNRELVAWALENLLTNAVSALDKPAGVIEVTVDRRKETEAVEVTVTDNGRGMTPAELKRAFEPGYTTKRRGWGLGLALARRVVVEYHGGRLFVRLSAPGQGTTMVVSFPT
ncbi:MAG: HAMP domain-containing histidine kinase [Candidatus Eisenbacteria bacterium]|nr:HAMP domain-containing histidine kinase [Candidatus Eisenbacteria bacterium]